MRQYRIIGLLLFAALFLAMQGCAYYNYLYNGHRNFQHGMDAKQVPNAAAGAGKADFDKVIDGCASMLDFFPDSRWVPEALLLMGKAYYETDQYSKAERKFLELEKNYPTSKFVPEAKLYKARCWLGLKKTQEGRDLLIALESEPDPDVQFSARLMLADGLMSDSLLTEAMEQYNGMVGKAPTKELEMATEQKRLACLLKLGQRNEAITTIGKLLKYKILRPKQHEYRILRSQLWVKTGQPKRAIDDLIDLRDDSKYFNRRDSTRVELGAAYFAAGDTTKALDIWNDLLGNDRTHNDITSEAAYYRGKYRFETDAIDSLITQDWTRADRDRPGSVYAVLADTALAHYRWKHTIVERYLTARDEYDLLQDLLVGNEVPDSVRNRYLLSIRPPRNRIDTTRLITVDTSKTTLSKSIQSDSVSTSRVNEKQPDTLNMSPKSEVKTEQLQSTKSDSVNKVVSVDSVKKESLQNNAKASTALDSGKISVAPSNLEVKTVEVKSLDTSHKSVKADTVSLASPDSLTLPIKTQVDTTKLTKQDTSRAARADSSDNSQKKISLLDTSAVLTAISDAEKRLLRVIDERKDEAFNRKDTAYALGLFPEILDVASGRSKSAYQLEFAELLHETGETIRPDSLYRLVANDTIHIAIANAARKALNMLLLSEPVDTIHEFLRGAEWVLDAFQDTTTAMGIYRTIAKADSTPNGEKAVAAMAILNINRVDRDSLEKLFDKMSKVVKDQKGVTFARKMVSYIQESRRQDSLNAIVDTSKAHLDSLKKLSDTLGVISDTTKMSNDSTRMIPDSLKLHITNKDTLKHLDSTASKADTNHTMTPDSITKKSESTTIAKPDSTNELKKPNSDSIGIKPNITPTPMKNEKPEH